jgi:hypothetical protein
MSINVQCAKCSKRYAAPDKLAGQRVMCPECGAAVDVPSAAAKSGPGAAQTESMGDGLFEDLGGDPDIPFAESGPAKTTPSARRRQTAVQSGMEPSREMALPRASKGRGKSGSKFQLSGRTAALLIGVAVLALGGVAAYTMVKGSGGSGSGRGRALRASSSGPSQPSPPGPVIPPAAPPQGSPAPPQPATPPAENPNVSPGEPVAPQPAPPAQAAPAPGPPPQPASPQPEVPPTGGPAVGEGTPPAGQGPPAPGGGRPAVGYDGRSPGYQQYPNPPAGPGQPGMKPQRPQDVAQWKMQDYFSARAEGDARLVEAVGHLGKQSVGNAAAAPLLAQLLAPPKAEEKPAEGTQPGYRPQQLQPNPQLVQAIVTALAINGTDVARTILVQLLAGMLPTEDDKAAVEGALKALVEHPSPQTDSILLTALTAPEKLRAASRGQVTADQLREKTLTAVSSTASEGLRTALARYLVQPATPPQWREQMGGFLTQQDPNNVGAQLILYQSEGTAPETKATFEQYFTAYSSAAMGAVLGIAGGEGTGPGQVPGVSVPRAPSAYGNPVAPRGPVSPQRPSSYDGPVGRGGYPAGPVRPNAANMGRAWNPAAGPNANQAQAGPADPDATYRRARQLWSAQTAAMIEGRLGQLQSLGDQAPLLILAGTFPVDSVRSAVWKALHDHWAEGPQPLESAGLSTSVITDPGLLLTIKTLPRRASAEAGSSLPGAAGSSYRAPNASSGRGFQQPADSYPRENRYRPNIRPRAGQPSSGAEPVQTAREAQDKRMQAERDWMQASERLVRAWCERFDAAGPAGAKASGKAGGSMLGAEPDATLPIKLHPQANVVSEYHLNWPADLGAKVSGVAPGPMEIHYLRIVDKADPAKRVGFYRRQLGLRLPDVHTTDNGYWMDRLQRVPQPKEPGPIDKTGWKRSVDILITVAQGSPSTSGQASPQPPQGQESDLVIQILSIEMKDPAKS